MRPFVKPLTTRDCADFMGVSTQWIRRAITDGKTLEGGTIVKLEAETIPLARRCTCRIDADRFLEFLQAIGWKHLPARVGRLPSLEASYPESVNQ